MALNWCGCADSPEFFKPPPPGVAAAIKPLPGPTAGKVIIVPATRFAPAWGNEDCRLILWSWIKFMVLKKILTCYLLSMIFLGACGAEIAVAANIAVYKEQLPTAQLGEAEFELFGPEGFQRIDGIDYDIDERLSIFHPKSSESLAIFAAPAAWKPFFDEIFGNSPRDLYFYATITTAPATREFEAISLNLEDISALLRLREIDPAEEAGIPIEIGETVVSPLAALSHGLRFISFKSDLLELAPGNGGPTLTKRYSAVVSAIEVEGQILFLNIFSNRRGPKDETVEELAAGWRDAYLVKTKSLRQNDLDD